MEMGVAPVACSTVGFLGASLGVKSHPVTPALGKLPWKRFLA
ncbi:hypothetical protein CRUP_005880 [Coryphaenoides rupestris]|nr:hypothetical protein CRUP_005880 [Coryphaenoides rupestris]